MLKEMFSDLKFTHLCPGVLLAQARNVGYLQYGITNDYGDFVVVSAEPQLSAQLTVSLNGGHDERREDAAIPDLV